MNSHMIPDQKFYQLDSEFAMEALETIGFKCTGSFLKLNSFENRVYDIFLDDSEQPYELSQHVIIKLYRPNRWTKNALDDEHLFYHQLKEAGLSVIAPLQINGQSVFSHEGIWFCVYKKGLGRLVNELSLKQYEIVGGRLAQIHNIGELQTAPHRPFLSTETFGDSSLEVLQKFVPLELWDRYLSTANDLLDYLDDLLDPSSFIRIHGDCHKGNLLIKDDFSTPRPDYMFVDFDDFINGPIEQDFWMLLPDTFSNSEKEFQSLMKGYHELRVPKKINPMLMEALRGLRIIHYSAWIGRRWLDPLFPDTFPQYKDYSYWIEELEALEKILWSI